MAREKLYRVPSEGVKWYKLSHNPTGELFKVVQGLIILNKKKH